MPDYKFIFYFIKSRGIKKAISWRPEWLTRVLHPYFHYSENGIKKNGNMFQKLDMVSVKIRDYEDAQLLH